jgi:activating signal cointegrator complex subunit 3
VRHNEDKLNVVLSGIVRWPVNTCLCDDPHTKANLLLQAHLSRLPLPITDYVTDLRTVLDNSLRLLQAMIDVAAHQGWLSTTTATIHLAQVHLLT